ncbi:uncharacterized protein LOC135346038 isoform X2 [Halichondria panicea]|uniref:uncharacterized protein LOC135346038 isoform X2 n=1 Tax=Halichondria panicea TaxID=6063 RepID=UPI00312B4731
MSKMRIQTGPGLALALCCLLLCTLASAQTSVEVLPLVMIEGKFQGQDFTRLCRVSGTTDDVVFEWLRDGLVIRSGRGANLELTISEVDFIDQGSYSCRATLDDSSVIGPASAGELIVLDRGMIHAPSVQYVEHGVEYSQLNCSYPGALPIWTYDGQTVSGELFAPSFGDEGVYICDLFYSDPARQIQASIRQEIRLHVFVPVDILHHPPAYIPVTGNPPLKLTVAFSGRQAQNMSITWYRNGIPLANSIINTTYSVSQLSGTTELKFTKVTRSQAGVYRVVIQSEVGRGVYSLSDTDEETSSQVDVTVPPATPIDFSSQDEFSTTAVFKWTLTNQNTDEGADTFIIQLMYDNGSFFRNETFPGGVSERRVSDLIPGTGYSARLFAMNEDGVATVSPISFSTTPGNPKLNEAVVIRRNTTHFTAQLSLAYTGGGSITKIIIEVFNFENENTAQFEVLATQSPNSNLVWNGDFTITDSSLVPETRLSFIVSARNEHGFVSDGPSVVVPAHATISTATTELPAPPGELDSTWLILVAVVVATVIITIVVVTLCVITICHCKKHAKKHLITPPKDHATVEKQLSVDNPLVTRGDTLEKHYPNPTIQLGSVPSVHSNYSGDNRYVEDPKLELRRVPSDVSSKASSYHTVSTTSNSPNTLKMIKHKNEKNVYPEGSTNSLRSDYDRNQLSQTESETMPLKPGQSYSQVHLAGSTCSSVHSSQQSIPILPRPYQPMHEHHHHHHHHHRRNYSVTSSISGIKEEDSGSERFELPISQLSQHQHRPNQYQQHATLSISGSEMDARPPSESVCTCSLTTGGERSPDYVYMSSVSESQQVSVV